MGQKRATSCSQAWKPISDETNDLVLSLLLPSLLTFFFGSEHLHILDDNMKFVNVTLRNEGMYQCGAENKHGMIVSATWVRVQGEENEYFYIEFIEEM